VSLDSGGTSAVGFRSRAARTPAIAVVLPPVATYAMRCQQRWVQHAVLPISPGGTPHFLAC
jgi:hypothetical protein